jgi:hypothetical protein
MRKFVTFAFIGALAVSVASCGSQGSNSASNLDVDSLIGPSALEARAPSGGGGKGGGKGSGGGGTTSGGGSLSLVMLNDAGTSGTSYGDTITFTVTTSAERPFVTVNCYQGQTWVYTKQVGFFDGYPWPKQFLLMADSWPGGVADCKATLYTTVDGTSTTVLATLSFQAAA